MSEHALPLPGRRRRDAARTRSIARPRPELLALVALALLLDLWALSRNGVANEYYAAAVKAMAGSWHDFLYGSADTAGVMTVDKPPLALWVQALSVRVFGFSSWSLLVPQALMGAGTVTLTYDLVRRPFGRVAGTVGGLALALTPITVAISRHDNPDALLVLCAVAALWAVVRALEDGRTRWLVLSGVAIGLGFETKMAAALLVVPGIVAAYLWAAPAGRLRAVRQLLAGGAAMAVVGLAWPVLVWLTPASSRPWISGTSDNSIWSLIFGYNGLGRLAGQAGGNTGGGGFGGGGGVFGGEPGVLRLLNASLGGQVGWLLGVAAVAAVGLAIATRLRRTDPRTGWLVAVGGALVVAGVAFSRAEGIFHPYYVSLLAPFVAALAGACATLVLDGGRLGRAVGAAALVVGGLVQWRVLREVGEANWIAPLVVAGGLGLAVVLGAAISARSRRIVATAGAALLLAVPAAWSMQTPGHATQGTFPAGGPASAGIGMGGGGPMGGRGGFGGGVPGVTGAAPGGTAGGGTTHGGTAGGGTTRGGFGGGMFGGDTSGVTAAVTYAKAHGGGTIAVSSQSTAASVLLADPSADVAGIGGFSGSESEVTTAWLADEVAAGHIRYVYVSTSGFGGGGMRDGRVGASAVLAAAQRVGTAVTGVDGLYDLQGGAAALRAL